MFSNFEAVDQYRNSSPFKTTSGFFTKQKPMRTYVAHLHDYSFLIIINDLSKLVILKKEVK